MVKGKGGGARHPSAIAFVPLSPILRFKYSKRRLAGYLLNAFFTGLSGCQIENKHAQRGTASRRKHVEQIALVMARGESYNQEVVSKRKEEERRIHSAHDQRAEVA